MMERSTGLTKSASAYAFGDRYIPTRNHDQWDTFLDRQNTTADENKEPIDQHTSDLNATFKALLSNDTDSFEQGSPYTPLGKKRSSQNLFQYSPTKKHASPSFARSASFSFNLQSPLFAESPLLHRATRRQISPSPYRVLDAPDLSDDFYLNLIDWSTTNMIAVGLSNNVFLWSAETGRVTQVCSLNHQHLSRFPYSPISDLVCSVAWSSGGDMLAVGTHLGTVQIWDATVCKLISSEKIHGGRVSSMAWNGSLITSGSRDRTIKMRDIKTKTDSSSQYTELTKHEQEVCGMKWSLDGKMLASGGNDNRLFIWSLDRMRKPVHKYKDHKGAIKALAWSPHRHGLLAAGCGTADRTIRFINTLTGQSLARHQTEAQVCNLAWSPHSNSELVSTHGYAENCIIVWQYPSMRSIARLTGHEKRVIYMALAPDGERIVTGAGDNTLRFWRVFEKLKGSMDKKSELEFTGAIR